MVREAQGRSITHKQVLREGKGQGKAKMSRMGRKWTGNGREMDRNRKGTGKEQERNRKGTGNAPKKCRSGNRR
jgi:hypothetical protein